MIRLMKGLTFTSGKTIYTDIRTPELQSDHDVLIKVLVAGICRTDLMIANGQICGIEGQAFGHEFCGYIVAKGCAVKQLEINQRVAVNPVLGCEDCDDCRGGNSYLCGNTGLLGIEQAGAFADYIAVNAGSCYPVPEVLSNQLAAYAEPIAAMLSVLDCDLKPDHRIAILGDDRIAALCQFILSTEKLTTIETNDASVVDVLIVTTSVQSLPLERLKTGGLIIVKSRLPTSSTVDFAELVRRRITLKGANYVEFERALLFIEQHQQALLSFIGKDYPLDQFASAFSANNSKKTFLIPCVG